MDQTVEEEMLVAGMGWEDSWETGGSLFQEAARFNTTVAWETKGGFNTRAFPEV